MNATYAKTLLIDRNICEVISYISVQLNIKIPWEKRYISEWHTYSYLCTQLKTGVKASTKVNIQSNLALLEYQICVYGLLVERLLNSKWKLTQENIFSDTSIMTNIIQYFTNWINSNEVSSDQTNVPVRV